MKDFPFLILVVDDTQTSVMKVLEQYFCFPAPNDLIAKLEDLGMKGIRFLPGAEHMPYMMLLSVTANLKSEIFSNWFFSPFCPCCHQLSAERCHTAASSLCYSGRCMMVRSASHSLFMTANCVLMLIVPSS